MKIKIANKILSLALATSMVLTSFVPSYAMEEPVDEGTPIEFLDENEEEEEGEESAAAASSSVEVKEETPLNSEAGDDEDDPENGDGTGEPKVNGEDDILILDEEEKVEEGIDSQKTPSVIKIKYELGEDVQLAEADKEKTSIEGFVGEEMTITLAEPVCDGQIFDGWYTTSDYTDADFTYVEDTNTWTYTFTPEEEEVSLTFYASFGFGSKLMGTEQDGETKTVKVNYYVVPEDIESWAISSPLPKIYKKLLYSTTVSFEVGQASAPLFPELPENCQNFQNYMPGYVFQGWAAEYKDYNLAMTEYHYDHATGTDIEGLYEEN